MSKTNTSALEQRIHLKKQFASPEIFDELMRFFHNVTASHKKRLRRRLHSSAFAVGFITLETKQKNKDINKEQSRCGTEAELICGSIAVNKFCAWKWLNGEL